MVPAIARAMADTIERRARELMLMPLDKAAYIRLMEGQRSEYQVQCPCCLVWIKTYETEILKHVRTCKALRIEENS